MHYRFQNILKFSKCFLKMLSTHFKHKNSPMVWTMLKTVEEHVKYFKVYWKPYWKFQGLGHTAEKGMTWLWCDLLKTYFTELIQLKYKLLIVGNSSMMCLLQKFLNLTRLWTFFIFYQTEWTYWVFLLPMRSQEHLKEIQAFEAAIWYLGDQ